MQAPSDAHHSRSNGGAESNLKSEQRRHSAHLRPIEGRWDQHQRRRRHRRRRRQMRHPRLAERTWCRLLTSASVSMMTVKKKGLLWWERHSIPCVFVNAKTSVTTPRQDNEPAVEWGAQHGGCEALARIGVLAVCTCFTLNSRAGGESLRTAA
jgi:hypothetical protein